MWTNWGNGEEGARCHAGGGQSPHPLDENEWAELERLRAENRQLRMEAEFAKKVAAWFTKDPQ